MPLDGLRAVSGNGENLSRYVLFGWKTYKTILIAGPRQGQTLFDDYIKSSEPVRSHEGALAVALCVQR